MVPSQSHRPVGEHRDAFGDPPAGLEREREQHETERSGQCPRSFLILLRSRKIQQREAAENALNGANPGTKKIQQGSKLITLSLKVEKWTSSFSHPEAEVGRTPILAA